MVANASRGRAAQVLGERSAMGPSRARPLLVCLLVLTLAPALVRAQTGAPKPLKPLSQQMFVRHVPNFVSLALDSAVVMIRRLDRGVVDSLVPDPAPSGIVIRQWPDTTARLADVRTIYLVVSSGPPRKPVPVVQVPRGNSIVQRGSPLTPFVPAPPPLPWWRQLLGLLDTTPWIVAGTVIGLLLLSVPVIRYFWPKPPRIVFTSGVGSARTSIAFIGPDLPPNAPPPTIDRDAVELVAQLSTAFHTVIAVTANDDLIRGDSHDD